MAVFGGAMVDFRGTNTVPNRMRKPSGNQVPPITIKEALRAIGSFARWRMLRELASGEAREIGELARAGHCTYESASKHMRALRKAGVVVLGRGRLYSLSPSVQVDPDKREVDFGFLLARFNYTEEAR
jgi:DNA-binding transcriptional ArsR family regulator